MRESAPQSSVNRKLETAARQYQQSSDESGDRGLMIRLGAVFGLAYVGFLAVWVWATRLRRRPTRR
jgi:hypothetical protein